MQLDQVAPPLAREPDPADQAIAIELTDQVRRALVGLADRQAEVFWLSCVEGQSHEQVAAQLQATPAAIRVLLHRARVDRQHVVQPDSSICEGFARSTLVCQRP